MSYKIIRTDEYFKKLKKFIKKHPDALDRYAKMIEILEIDPYHPSLRLHKLRGKLQDYHSVSITMQYRVVIDIGVRHWGQTLFGQVFLSIVLVTSFLFR